MSEEQKKIYRVQQYLEVPIEFLVEWFSTVGSEAWWTVDGDHTLSGLIAFPCDGLDLASVLLSQFHKLKVRIIIHEIPTFLEISIDNLEDLVGVLDDCVSKILELKWIGESKSWFILEDITATKAMNEETAK